MARPARPGGVHRVALLLHRYVGLAMTGFLVVAGLTGTAIAFYRQLDAALNPTLFHAPPPSPTAKLLDPFVLQLRVQAALGPNLTYREVRFDPKPDEAIIAWVEPEKDKWRETFVSPYTGAVLGSRDTGNLSDGVVRNLMPFVYRLHYSLALGEVGTTLFGIVALLWTVDCFVGAYLTFPLPDRRGGTVRRSWLRRWGRAWRIRSTKLMSLVFTWHRASGLWVWAVCLVFAWSAVGLNLEGVYAPVMKTFAGFQDSAHDRLPELERPFPEPRLSLREARDVGRRLMAEEATRRGFVIKNERWVAHHGEHAAYSYGVESSLDLSSESPSTEVYFDANDGHLLGFDAPTGISAGNTITSYLYALHFAALFGTWYRVFVGLFGLAVVALSVTGVWIWLRKRSKSRGTELELSPESAGADSEP